ncbi:hypothetical protein Tco_1063343 [Tanacetum coccineum]
MSQKTSNAFNISVGWKFSDYVDFGFVNLKAYSRHFVSKNDSFFNHEVTFFLIKDKICIFTRLKHFIDIVETIIERVSKDGEVDHEYFYKFFDHVMKDSQHAPLKSSGCIALTKRHSLLSVCSERACESSFYLIYRIDRYLKISRKTIKEIKVFYFMRVFLAFDPGKAMESDISLLLH